MAGTLIIPKYFEVMIDAPEALCRPACEKIKECVGRPTFTARVGNTPLEHTRRTVANVEVVSGVNTDITALTVYILCCEIMI